METGKACCMMILISVGLGADGLVLTPDCNTVLGMESGKIPDSAITASSSSSDDLLPFYARIRQDEGGGAWCPNGSISRGSYEFLQIDFEEMQVFTICETQGRFAKGSGHEYTEQYRLEYQREESGPWFIYRNHRGQDLLNGNANTYGTELQMLDPPIIALRVRFVPYSESPIRACVRLELYGCSWKDHLISYNMPQGESRGKLELADFLYDGQQHDALLEGGLGQLTDGEVGDSKFKVDPSNTGRRGYHWIGWQNDSFHDNFVPIVFKFDSLRNFTEFSIHANNLFNRDVAVFSRADILFSMDGQTYSTDQPLVFNYQPDNTLAAARWVSVALNHRVGRYVKVQLYFYKKWIMISEVGFISDPVPEATTTAALVPSLIPSSDPSQDPPGPHGSTSTAAGGVSGAAVGAGSGASDAGTGGTGLRSTIVPVPTLQPAWPPTHGIRTPVSWTPSPTGIILSEEPSELIPVAEPKSNDGFSEIHVAIIIAIIIVFILIVIVIVFIVCLRRRRSKQKRDAAGFHGDCIRGYDGHGVYGYDKSNGLYRQEAGGSGLTSCCSNLNTSSTYSDLPDTNSLRHPQRIDYPKTSSFSDTYAVPDIMQSALMGSPDDPTLSLLPQDRNFPPPPYPPTISGTLVHQHPAPHIPMYSFTASPIFPMTTRQPLPPSIPIPPPPLPVGTFTGPYATSELGVAGHISRASTPGSMGGRGEMLARPQSVASTSGIQGVTGSSVYAVADSDPPCSNLGLPEIPYSSLMFRQMIGSGHFGEVYLATTKGRPTSGRSSVASLLAQGDMLIAVKMLKPIADARTREAFERETQLMWRLQDPNIVQVLGVSPETRTQPLGIVLEYMPHGDLYQFLRDSHEGKKNVPQLSNSCLIYMAAQVASGMKYLECLNMVHRDLATRNCLVGPQYLIKIGDFGMSRALYSSDYYSMEGQALLPIRWMAWESILYSKFSPRSDVWSFGVLLWEVFTFAQEQPYSFLADDQVIKNADDVLYQNGKQIILSSPPSCPPEIYSFMCQCWQRDTAHRPSFIDAHTFLQKKNAGFSPTDPLMTPDVTETAGSDTESEAEANEETPIQV